MIGTNKKNEKLMHVKDGLISSPCPLPRYQLCSEYNKFIIPSKATKIHKLACGISLSMNAASEEETWKFGPYLIQL